MDWFLLELTEKVLKEIAPWFLVHCHYTRWLPVHIHAMERLPPSIQ